MAIKGVTLSNSSVNSGTEVDIHASEITFKHSNHVRSPFKAGFLTTSDTVGEVDLIGWENPNLVVQGLFDEKDAKSNTATIALLKSFTKDTNSSTYFKDNLMFTTYQKVAIEGLTMNRTADNGTFNTGSDTYKGTIMNYTLNLILTE